MTPPHAILRRILLLIAFVDAVWLAASLLFPVASTREQWLMAVMLVISAGLHALLPHLRAASAGAALIAALGVAVPLTALETGFGPIQVAMAAVIGVLCSVLYGRMGVLIGVSASILLLAVVAPLSGTDPAGPLEEWLVAALGTIASGALLWWRHAADEDAREAVLRGATSLMEQESKYAELVRNAPDGVISIGLDGRLRSASPAVARMTGFDDEDLLGRLLWELPWWSAEARPVLQRGFTRLLTGGTFDSAVLRTRGRSGAEGWFEARASLVRNGDGSMAVHATLRDVSEREQAAHARKAYERGLQQAERVELMGRLAGSVAHDFNNLLAVISANAQLLARGGLTDSRRALHDLQSAADLGARLTRKLMSMTSSPQLEIRALDVEQVLVSLRPVLRSALPSSIELNVQVEPGTPRIAAGSTHLEQILVNLTVNARDAMPDGGALSITVGPTRRLDPDADPQWVRMVVQDSGVGIGPEHRGLVFEPFFSTKGNQGTGLGLASVLSMLKQLGGHIDLQSTLGEGSIFTLYFRAAEEAEQDTEVVEVPIQQMRPPCGGSVLLVEDGDPVRRATRRSLSHLGYDVIEVASVPGALAELEQTSPDVILSDVVMPYHTGVDLLHEVRDRWPTVPVVLMSAHASVPGAEEADAFLPKPFSLEEVADVLERARQHRGG